MSPSSTALKGCLVFHSGCMGAMAFTRSSAKASCTYIGCSTQSVPSLSKVAMRWSTGTKSGPPCVRDARDKVEDRVLVAPSFQDGSGSPALAPAPTVKRSEADSTGSIASDESKDAAIDAGESH